MYVKKKKCMDLLYPTKAKGTKNKLDNRQSTVSVFLDVTQRSPKRTERCVTSKKTAAKETTSQVNQPFCNKNLTDYITTVETIVSFLSRVLLSAHLLLRYND